VKDLEKALDIKSMDDWYNISTKDVQEIGGGKWIGRYQATHFILIFFRFGSLYAALKDVYPTIDASKFKRKPGGFWDDKVNRIAFVKSLEQQFSIFLYYLPSIGELLLGNPCRY
jgi:hypothetical protein